MPKKHYVDRLALLAFLKTHHPKLYEKYKDHTDTMLHKMMRTEQKPILNLLTKMAIQNKYLHGDVIDFMSEGYRNRGLLFWDAMKEKVIPPTYAHEEASVPEQFLVGDGFFDPNGWDKAVDSVYAVRPCKAFMKEIKDHFKKQDTSLNVTINGKKYTVVQDGDDWENFNWTKMMLIPYDTSLHLMDHLVAEKNTNEEKLRAHLNGDRTQQTRRVDLETKLEEAEKRLADAIAEVARLRKELVSGRGTRRV